MPNEEHVSQLLIEGTEAWNAWRARNPGIRPSLIGADLRNMNLFRANLREANLALAQLGGANLAVANLSRADLTRADLSNTNLDGANLDEADLIGANLSGATLDEADLFEAILARANLCGANLRGANLRGAILNGATLRGADLSFANLVQADVAEADLTGCRVYGVSAWGLKSESTKQLNLIITDWDEPQVTVDDIEVAQFVYILLHNSKIRKVIDTIGRKSVLILGRFSHDRKLVLDALREELRLRNYVPILFDFDKPTSKDLTGTILTLAHMARFIIADLTDPSCIPYEVSKISDAFVPVQPILLTGKSEFVMFADLQRRYHWVLPTHCYDSQEQLIIDLNERVIDPAERKVLELRGGAKSPSEKS